MFTISEMERHILEDGLLTQYLSDKAAAQATRELIGRENRRQRHLVAIGAVLAGIGIAGLIAVIDGRVQSTVSSDTTREIMSNIAREQLEREVGQLRYEVSLQSRVHQLTYLAFSLDFRDSFTREDRDKVVELLISLSTEETVLENTEFPLSLQKAVRSLVEANLFQHVDRIVEAYGDYILKIKMLGTYLSNIYGRYLLYYRKNDLESAASVENVFLRLEQYAEMNDNQGSFKSWRMAFDVLTASTPEEKAEGMRRNVEELRLLNVIERASVLTWLIAHQESTWYQISRDITTEVVTDVHSEIWKDYGDKLGKIMRDPDWEEVRDLVVQQLVELDSGDAAVWFLGWLVSVGEELSTGGDGEGGGNVSNVGIANWGLFLQ